VIQDAAKTFKTNIPSADVGVPVEVRVERRFGSFQRSIGLPTTVKADAIQASLDNGVLRLEIPKAGGSYSAYVTSPSGFRSIPLQAESPAFRVRAMLAHTGISCSARATDQPGQICRRSPSRSAQLPPRARL